MNLNDIIERFTLVSGMKLNEASHYLPLIVDCKEYFEERLIAQPDEGQRKRLAHACAVYAYYRVSLLQRDGGYESFKAGDVQIEREKREERCRAAGRLWDEERAIVAGLVRFDGGFAVRSVRI